MRILAISSQVAYGPVGNTAAVPALQAEGHEVMAVPTITLSNHPGHGKPAGFRTEAAHLTSMFEALDKLGVLKTCAAVLTGYFASADQVRAAATVLGRMKAANSSLYVLIDPVIGDGAALYVPQDVAEAIRDELMPLATCLTPNRFELEWLTSKEVTNVESAIAAARELIAPEVLATSIPASSGELATLAITKGAVAEWLSPLKPAVPHGTGDFLAGLYLAQRLLHGPKVALPRAMTILEAAIDRSAGCNILDIAGTLRT
jgi:pyridoxine kinase